MPSRRLQAAALTLTALGLAPGAAHVMEMPVKLGYSPELYAAVTSTLYAGFGFVGGTVQVAAVAAVGWLAFRARRLPARWMAAASAAALLASLLLWGATVAPVNAAWAQLSGASATEFAAEYDRLRLRWEYGHLAAFIAWLSGWLGLVATVTGLTAADAAPDL
jgi:hypothetical protein